MSQITYQTVLEVVSNINSFAEQSDQKISQLWSSYNGSKSRLEEQCKNFMTQVVKERDAVVGGIKKRALSLKENADKIYQEVLTLDATLANADKYYVKTRAKKTQELAQVTETSVDNEADVFVALEKVKEQYEAISSKYSREALPALVDGVIYIFSKQRKQDYEELIILKNTIEKLMGEIKQTIPELITDATQAATEKYDEQVSSINTKYQAEVTKIDARYEQNVEALADEICAQLDTILSDKILKTFKVLNESYPYSPSNIVASYGTWGKAVVLGCVDYPLELFVSSNILFSLIADKCGPILVQKKLLRFPLVFSLTSNFNLLIKHTQGSLKEQLINSVIQGFLSSVPVSYLSLSIIDAENRGKGIAPFAELYRKLPEMFGDEILTTNDAINERLESLAVYMDECSRYKLGSSYNNIFEYAKDNSEKESPEIKVLFVFDTPETLGDRNIALINNIIESGSSCGVYAVIAVPQTSMQSSNTLPIYREKDCISVQQASDMFMYYGLRMVYNPSLEGKEMVRYINRYLLSFDSVYGNVATLDADVCKLVISENLEDTSKIIASVKRTLEKYKSGFGVVALSDGGFPAGIPMGRLSVPTDLISDTGVLAQLKAELASPDANVIDLPATFNLTQKNNLFITCPEVIHQQIEKFVHSLMWSFLTFVPVSKVNFCIFDAERRGNSITPFLDFHQRLPDVFDGQIYTSQDAMTSRLQKLNSYIDDFIQQKLGNKFDNIIEYNIKNPNRAEAVNVLVIFDFPRNFDGRSIELLLNILSNGGKCGIFTILCYNPNITFSRYENIDEHLADIKEHCSVIEYADKKHVIWPYELAINIAPELPSAKVDTFINQYVEANEVLKRKGLALEDAVQPPFFMASSAKRLSIPVGIGDAEEVAHLVLGEGSSHHGIIAGATGSGKSTLLHTIIMSGMLRHSPDELHLYLMDFKSGTEFKVYESVNLPHVQLLALDAMQEFGESILENLVDEMLRRGTLFKDSGQTSLSGYVGSTGNPLPRILVIMDEFQVLYNDSSNRKVAMNCAELTKRIVTEGRAFGIHLLMATQTTKVISDLTLSHAIIEQMRVRIGLKCGEDDVRYLFSDRNDTKALAMMKGPIGTAVMNLEYMESSNIGFQTAYCNKDAQRIYLNLIAEKYADRPIATQTFEGNRTIPLLDYLTQNQVGMLGESIIKVPMGTLIKVAPPFVMQFDRRRRHNLLICGANEGMTENLTNLLMFSAFLNTDASIYCIDGESLHGESNSELLYAILNYGAVDLISERFFSVARSEADIIKFVNEMYYIYTARKKSDDLKHTFVIIKNMQFIDIVKKMFKGEAVDESEFECVSDDNDVDESIVGCLSENAEPFNFVASNSYSNSSLTVGEKLLQLIENGSSKGIFFVVSSPDYQSVKENMSYSENILAKFPERIIFALNNNDADYLIDGVAVSGLRDNTVYFTDGIKATFQYKPYVMPTADELQTFLESLFVGSNEP